MPLNFPSTPALNQYYVFNGIRWRWNGYAWTSAGVCGGDVVVGGICGDYVAALTGGVGITLTSPSGVVEISLKLDEPNIGPPNTEVLHTASTSFSPDIGYARKTAFLQPDGSITFDYIKNYDVFRNAEFNFDVVSFNIAGLNPQLAGIVGSDFDLNPFNATMSYIQTAISANIFLPGAAPTQSVGFPAIVTDLGFDLFDFTTERVRYKTLTYNNIGSNPDNYIFRLGVTGENSDGTQTYKTRDYILYFYNHIIYGESQNPNITSLNPLPGLSAVINGSRNYTLNFTMQQNTQNPWFLYYAYPSRLGLASFRDNSTNLEGGFILQGTVNYTNPNGYSENYNIYRSEQSNLGQISITVL